MSLLSDTGIPDIEIEKNGTSHDSTSIQGTVNSILLSITAWYKVGMSSYIDILYISKRNKFNSYFMAEAEVFMCFLRLYIGTNNFTYTMWANFLYV